VAVKNFYGLDSYKGVLMRGHERHGECLFSNATPTVSGYRTVKYGRKTKVVHRVVYEKWHGEIPEGFVVDHICHNEAAAKGECAGGNSCQHRRCINPGHLRAVTSIDNVKASPLGRRQSKHQTSKTYCPSGHEYTPENIKWGKRKGTGALFRMCRICYRGHNRKHYHRSKNGPDRRSQ